MERQRISQWIVGLLTVVLVSAACGAGSSGQPQATATSTAGATSQPVASVSVDSTPIKIGLSTGLTGTFAALGEAQQKGVELAIKQLNGKAGNHPISAIIRDDQLKPDLATQNAKSLVQTERVNFLTGCLSAATAPAINQVAKEAGIPYLATCQGEVLSRKPELGPLTFHVTSTQTQFVRAVIPWVVKNLGKRIVLQLPDFVFGKEEEVAHLKAIPAAGGEIVATLWNPLGTTDFTPFFPKILAANPDVLFVGFSGADYVNYLKQAKQFGLDKRMKIFGWFSDIQFDQELGFDMVAGTYGASNFDWTNSEPSVQKFVKDYQTAYAKPPSLYAATAYNAIMLIAEQVKNDKYRPDDFAKALSGLKFNLALGPQFIRTCDHQTYQPTYISVGLTQADAASKGGSAQFGYRQVLATIPASEADGHTCAELGLQ